MPAAEVVFEATNAGRAPHEVVLAFMGGPGVTTSAQVGSTAKHVVTHPIGYLRPRAAGLSGTFAVDLAPGRYLLGCFVRDPDGTQHYTKGMRSEFVVR